MPAVNIDEIRQRVLQFLRRLVGHMPTRTDQLQSIIPNWPASTKAVCGEIRFAGEFRPYQLLLDSNYLADLKTVEDLIEYVQLAIQTENESTEQHYTPDAAGQDDDDVLGFQLEVQRDFTYAAGGSGFIKIPVWFATDRKPTGSQVGNEFFGPARSVNGLTYGVVEVTVPNTHIIGQLEAPSFWRFQYWDDPTKHVLLDTIYTLDEPHFFAG